jgi:YgiT-type zinc finger domain-containing protein
MKCIICHSTDITVRRVNKQLSRGEDIVLVPVEVLVCNNCGERYYDRRTMERLEEIEDAVNAGRVSLERVGEVLRVKQELIPACVKHQI